MRDSKYNKLVIISHTGHQIHPVYGPVGWGPTVREINFLAGYWQEVVHVACLEHVAPAGSSLPYTNRNICFVSIPTFGGTRWWQKLDILIKAPQILLSVHKALKGASEVQVRLPMGIGLILLPYFKLVSPLKYKMWIKYATNWGKSPDSLSYRWQKHLLQSNWLSCPVTINGAWPDQPEHCKTFENPCLTQEQFERGEAIARSKILAPPYTFIFIGRIDSNKGVDLLIKSIPHWPKHKIAKIHIVGEGPLLETLNTTLLEAGLAAEFHGSTTQEYIFNLLEASHFLILPSKSEGFPKVLAEGLNLGCIPIASSVGSIPHYIRHYSNGLLISELNDSALTNAVLQAVDLNSSLHKEIIGVGRHLARQFTFEYYLQLLKKEILDVT